MLKMPWIRFQVTRNGYPIADVHLSGGVNAGINYNMSYAIWDAAIAAGASLDELRDIDKGKYPSWFLGKIIAWHIASRLIHNHQEDAVAASIKAKSKKR